MQFTWSGLFFTAVALTSAAVAEDAPNSSGCDQGTCWASCIITYDDDGTKINAPDPTITYVDGGNWCWLTRGNGATPPVWDWAACSDGCDLHVGDLWCDINDENACGPSED